MKDAVYLPLYNSHRNAVISLRPWRTHTSSLAFTVSFFSGPVGNWLSDGQRIRKVECTLLCWIELHNPLSNSCLPQIFGEQSLKTSQKKCSRNVLKILMRNCPAIQFTPVTDLQGQFNLIFILYIWLIKKSIICLNFLYDELKTNCVKKSLTQSQLCSQPMLSMSNQILILRFTLGLRNKTQISSVKLNFEVLWGHGTSNTECNNSCWFWEKRFWS